MSTQIATIKQAWKARLLSEASDREIAQALNRIYFTIGLRPQHFPTKEEDLILFAYLRKNYAGRTLEELFLAFDLAINEKLDVQDFRVYDQFSIEYLVRIMNSYGRYVFKMAKETKALAPLPPPEEARAVSDSEKMADLQEFFDGPDRKILPLYLFDWLEQLGFLNYSEEEKVRLYRRAINERQRSLENDLLRNVGDAEIKGDLERLRENIRKGFKGASPSELSAIHTEYKKIVLIDQKKKNKK